MRRRGRWTARLAAGLLTLLAAGHPGAVSAAPGAAPLKRADLPPILTQGLTVAYDFTPGGQVLRDISGRGLDATLGSGPQADGSDPVWAGRTLRFDGQDDYVRAPLSTPFDRDFTSYVVVRFDQVQPLVGTPLSFGSARSNLPYLIVYKRRNDPLWALYYNTDVHEQSAQGVLPEATKGFVLLALKRRGAQFELAEVGSRQALTLPVKGPLGVTHKTLGANLRQVLSSVARVDLAWQHDLNYATSAAQDQATWQALRALLGPRGIELR